MPFKGHFDSFFISKIFQFLNEENKTGVLTLEYDAKKAFILLRDGRIVYVKGCSDRNRVGRYLVREGVISEKDLARVVELADKNGKSFGKTLIELKLAAAKDLKQAIERQAIEILFDAFSWESGEFYFEDADVNAANMIFFELNIMKLVFDAARRIDEMKAFEKNINPRDVFFRVPENIKKQRTITLDAEAWKILSLIDGIKSVREIVEASDYSRFDVYKVIDAMMSVGLVAVREPEFGETAPEPEETVVQVEEGKPKKTKSLFSFLMGRGDK